MLSDKNKLLLKSYAKKSIEYGSKHDRPLPINLENQNQALIKQGASFVTLTKHHKLRGCIGSLEAWRPLLEDVIDNSFAAAFRDRRFDPVSAVELEHIIITISILSPPEPITCHSEKNLISQLRPHIDGLIVKDDSHRATFLPTVWQSLPEPNRFLRELKTKAGLPNDYWSQDLIFYRYTTDVF